MNSRAALAETYPLRGVAALSTTPEWRRYDKLLIGRIRVHAHETLTHLLPDATTWPTAIMFSLTKGDVAVIGPDQMRLRFGDCAVIAVTPTVRFAAASDGEVLIVCIPRTEVEVHGKEIARAQGTVISTVTGAASLVGHVLRGMATQFDQPDEASFGRLSFHVVGLMSVMCAQVMGDGAQYESRSSTVEKAKEFIELNLADESLCPATVAAAHNVSSRTLHRLFEEENETPSRWIRLRRLERCRSDLLDESLAELSISDIGARWGVCDPAHFSRLFKAQFGVAPREFRRRARGGRRLESV